MDAIQKEKIAEMLKSFKVKLVTNDLLDAYCKRHKIVPSLVMSQYEDYLFQFEHDERFTKIMPLMMAALSGLRQPPEFCTPEEYKAVQDNNSKIENDLAGVLEENGILWEEGVQLLGNFGILLASCVERSKNGVKNMGEATMRHIAEQQLGTPLTIKMLTDYYRKVAEKLL